MRPLCIYHGGCRDGFAAAWVAWSALKGDIEFHPGYYGQPPPDVTSRNVYVLDFSYPREVMDEMAAKATSLLVLDHHKTAEAALAGASYATFDMKRSGAGLAWDHWFADKERPWLVDYIEDRDLWTWRLPSSRDVNAWLAVLPFEFKVWDVWGADDPERLGEAEEKGKAIRLKVGQYVAEAAKNARRIWFGTPDHIDSVMWEVPIVNAPQVDISELLDHVAEGETFAVGWWQRADGVFQYSLRSRGDFDVSHLAKMYGGGGHKNAAGFQSSELHAFVRAAPPPAVPEES